MLMLLALYQVDAICGDGEVDPLEECDIGTLSSNPNYKWAKDVCNSTC